MSDLAPTPPASARDRILDTALRLFYQNGIRATGIDRIIAESGVAKMSFYRHFPSKRDLVLAFLEKRHRFWMDWFVNRVEALGREGACFTPIADALKEWFADPLFRGCAFINTVAESDAEGEAERRASLQHKEELCDFIEARIRAHYPAARARETARLVLLVIEGAIVRAQMTGDPGIADEARVLLAGLEAGLVGNAVE